jgi:ubiquinone/menaquinone biosynthesis C-methylase UbiE
VVLSDNAPKGITSMYLETLMVDNVSKDLLDAGRDYEKMYVPALFAPWPPHLTNGARVRKGSHVLDIACGTGVLARHAFAAVGPTGRVVGVDPAPGMLAAAREVEPTIDWVLCGAEALELEDASFDCVMSQFGMMFFQDRAKAIGEMLRVLKPGGSLAIAVWDSVERNPGYLGSISVLK